MAESLNADHKPDTFTFAYLFLQCVESIFQSVLSAGLVVPAVKWLLIFEHVDLFPLAVKELHEVQEVG